MSSLRLQNDPSFEEEEVELSDSDPESVEGRKTGKNAAKIGRPRGKGRPKRSSKGMCKKVSEDQEEWEEKVYARERATPGKQQSSIEGYIKIIDYLKKIDYDEHSLQNKMNPFNALTATCFWYAISAEFYSFDFFSRRNPHDVAMEQLEKVQRQPLPLANRITKTNASPSLLDMETEQLNRLACQIGEKMGNIIPAPLPARPETIERKIGTSTVAEDDQFISSTRAILYKYISKKIKNSQKWTALFNTYEKQISELPSVTFPLPDPITFAEEEAPCQEINLFELLRQQAKKKVMKRDKNREARLLKGNEIFHDEDSHKEEESVKEQNKEGQAVEQSQSPKKQVNHFQRGQLNVENQKSKQNDEVKEQNIEEQQPQKAEIAQKIDSAALMKEQVEEKMQVQNIPSEYTKKHRLQDVIIDSILHMPLEKVISMLQSSLPSIQLPTIKEPMLPLPTKDPLEFVFKLHPEEQKYLEYMKEQRKKKYRQRPITGETTNEQDERQGQFQDAKCQICTDGDYTDDNLIVFCSMCNISLHQRCVGLAKVPAQSWVCDVCLAFGPGGINLPCPLCDVKGGAMKRTSIHIDTNLFKQTNPGYYQYSKKCPYNKQKEQYMAKEKVEGQEPKEEEGVDQPVKVVRERGEKQQECYYDYFVKSTYPTEVPSCHYVWVHYVCAIWVPECYFEEKNGNISVRGIQNIEHKRFKNECFVCKKNKCGACVKCQDSQCHKYYHPECARKKKVYMEQLNLEKLKYLIFCEEHEPLKLTRQIQYKKKKNRQEIIKFARMIQKYIETYRIAQFPFKLMKAAVPSNFIDTSHKVEKQIKDRRILAANSDQQFLKDLISNLSKAKIMTVHLEKVENGYKITNVQTPSKRQIRKCLNRYDQFWNSIKNGDTNQQNFRRYERIMLENQRLKERLEQFLNGNLSIRSKNDQKKEKKLGKRRGKNAIPQVETLIQQEGGIFCVCKKPYEGETDMFECQVCGEWYHFRCLGFIGSQADAQTMEFSCMKCMKFQPKDKKQQRLAKYNGLFAPDSIVFLYRPPTPDLLSEEQVQQKNYVELMEQVKKMSSPQKQKAQDNEAKIKKQLAALKITKKKGSSKSKQSEVKQQNTPAEKEKAIQQEKPVQKMIEEQAEYENKDESNKAEEIVEPKQQEVEKPQKMQQEAPINNIEAFTPEEPKKVSIINAELKKQTQEIHQKIEPQQKEPHKPHDENDNVNL